MATQRLELLVDIDPSGAITGIKKLDETAGKASDKAVAGNKKNTDSIEDLKAGYLLAAAAITGVALAITKSIEAYAAQERAEGLLEQAFSKTTANAKEATKQFSEFASARQLVTKYGDEVTIQAAAQLEALTHLDQEGLQKAIIASQDLATAQGIDLASAANLVGKSIGSTHNVLARYGIAMADGGDTTARLNDLTGTLAKKFGGFAEKEGQSVTGRLAILKNSFGDVQEVIGKVAIDVFGDDIQKATKKMSEFSQAAGDPKGISMLGKLVLGLGVAWDYLKLVMTPPLSLLRGLASVGQATFYVLSAGVDYLLEKFPIIGKSIDFVANGFKNIGNKISEELNKGGNSFDAFVKKTDNPNLKKALQTLRDGAKDIAGDYTASIGDARDKLEKLFGKMDKAGEEHKKKTIDNISQITTKRELDAEAIQKLEELTKSEQFKTAEQVLQEKISTLQKYASEYEVTADQQKAIAKSIAEYEKQLSQLRFKTFSENFNKITSMIKDVGSTVNDIQKFFHDAEMQRIEDEKNAKLSQLDISNQYSEAIAAMDAEDREQKEKDLQAEIDAANAAGDTKLANEKSRELERMKLQDQAVERDKQIADQKAEIDKDAKKKEYDAELKSFGFQKALKIGQSIIATATAVVNALAVPIIGPILATIAGIAGAAQTAIIAAEQPPAPPAFAFGGTLGGGPTSGDKTLFRGNAGETILNTTQGQNLFNSLDRAGLLSGQSGGSVVNNSSSRTNNTQNRTHQFFGPVYLQSSDFDDSVDKRFKYGGNFS